MQQPRATYDEPMMPPVCKSTSLPPPAPLPPSLTAAAEAAALKMSDSDSRLGKFGWSTVAGINFPHVYREGQEYVSVQMIEQKILSKYPSEVPACLQQRPPLVSYFITDAEATLLNDINKSHCNSQFGVKEFKAGQDLIVELNEFKDFYKSVQNTYPNIEITDTSKMTLCHGGWLQVNNTVVPYIWRTSKQYVPLQVIRYAAGLLADIQVFSESIGQQECDFLNGICKEAGLVFEFDCTAKVICVNTLTVCRSKIIELPADNPFKHAVYISEEEASTSESSVENDSMSSKQVVPNNNLQQPPPPLSSVASSTHNPNAASSFPNNVVQHSTHPWPSHRTGVQPSSHPTVVPPMAQSLPTTAPSSTQANGSAQSLAQPVAQPVHSGTSQSLAQPMHSGTSQSFAQPLVQPVHSGASQSLAQPMHRGVSQSLAQPLAQPMHSGVSQSLAQPLHSGVSHSLTQPLAQPVHSGAVQSMAQPVHSGAVQSLAQPVHNGAAQSLAQPLHNVVLQQAVSTSTTRSAAQPSSNRRGSSTGTSQFTLQNHQWNQNLMNNPGQMTWPPATSSVVHHFPDNMSAAAGENAASSAPPPYPTHFPQHQQYQQHQQKQHRQRQKNKYQQPQQQHHHQQHQHQQQHHQQQRTPVMLPQTTPFSSPSTGMPSPPGVPIVPYPLPPPSMRQNPFLTGLSGGYPHTTTQLPSIPTLPPAQNSRKRSSPSAASACPTVSSPPVPQRATNPTSPPVPSAGHSATPSPAQPQKGLTMHPDKFHGKSISLMHRWHSNGTISKVALVEALVKVCFVNTTTDQFLTTMHWMFSMELEDCSREEEIMFIKFYTLPTEHLKCKKIISIDTFDQYYEKLVDFFNGGQSFVKQEPEEAGTGVSCKRRKPKHHEGVIDLTSDVHAMSNSL